jgi:hypothetical protein
MLEYILDQYQRFLFCLETSIFLICVSSAGLNFFVNLLAVQDFQNANDIDESAHEKRTKTPTTFLSR